MAIDNDMAFGKKHLDHFKTEVSRDSLFALPPEFADRIMQLDAETLMHELSDVIPADELAFVGIRLEEIKAVIRERRQIDPDFTNWQDPETMQQRFASYYVQGSAEHPANLHYFKAYPNTAPTQAKPVSDGH